MLYLSDPFKYFLVPWRYSHEEVTYLNLMDRDDLEEPEEDERTPFLDHTINNFKEGINADEVIRNSKISQENDMPIEEENTEALLEDEDINSRLLDVIRHNILYAYFFKNNGINNSSNN